MSTETTPQAPPAWGDPQPPAPKWSGKKTLVAAVVAIAIAAVGGVAIYAGTSSNDSSQQQGGFGGPGGAGGRMGNFGGGRMGGAAALTDALHGEFTVSENGTYVTERMQRGDVTALSGTSITVKSTDGYTQTYTIDSATDKASNLATGSTAMVIAKVNGTGATATSITDANQAQGRGGMPGGGQNGGQLNGAPAFPGQQPGTN
ncbi:MAG TPA: hypothetical protein VHC18_08555 [Amycolatopsis sp.]|nr:hypothetical protein [Amycolatopsis sp.]